MQDQIFGADESADDLKQGAGTRDGAFAVLLGIAARRSIDTGLPVRVADLSVLKPTRERTG
jgi:hypothetical protein